MSDPLLDVCAVLDKVRQCGNAFEALCPAHEDAKRSFTVTRGEKVPVVVKCHAGCEYPAIRDALAARGVDLGARSNDAEPRPKVVATYRYCDEDGGLLFAVERTEPKGFRQWRPDGARKVYRLDGVRRVPYRLAELRAGIESGRWVLVAEGEKSVDALVAAGFVATCSPQGAGKWRDEYTAHFAGAKVVVLPDHDEPGRAHAETIAGSLHGVAKVVKMLPLPGLPAKGDPFDWLAGGGTAEQLRELILGADEWKPGFPSPSRTGPPESGAVLLDDVERFTRRFVVTSDAALVAAALFIVHTHAFDAADCTPRFVLTSKEPQSGKTRFAEVLRLLVSRPLFVANISEPALFRRIDAGKITLLVDEVDAIFGPKARDREDLRALLNAGYERGAVVTRCVGEGSKMTTKDFGVFAPVVLAGLGRLPETIEQRSIIVRLKRRAPSEPVEKLRRRTIGADADPLRERVAAWAEAHLPVLAASEPELPDGLSDRAGDVWEPLLAIADHAGGTWPERARHAAIELFSSRDTDQSTLGVRLLADVRSILTGEDGIASGDLAGRLAAIEGSPWPTWGRDDMPLTAHALAKLLRGYDIKPGQHRIGTETFRGYLVTDFEDAWSRYLPPTPAQVQQPSKCNIPSPARATDVALGQLLHSYREGEAETAPPAQPPTEPEDDEPEPPADADEVRPPNVEPDPPPDHAYDESAAVELLTAELDAVIVEHAR